MFILWILLYYYYYCEVPYINYKRIVVIDTYTHTQIQTVLYSMIYIYNHVFLFLNQDNSFEIIHHN